MCVCFLYVLRLLCRLSSFLFFFLMIRRPPRSTLDRSSAASDVYKRQEKVYAYEPIPSALNTEEQKYILGAQANIWTEYILSLIHISEPTRPY